MAKKKKTASVFTHKFWLLNFFMPDFDTSHLKSLVYSSLIQNIEDAQQKKTQSKSEEIGLLNEWIDTFFATDVCWNLN